MSARYHSLLFKTRLCANFKATGTCVRGGLVTLRTQPRRASQHQRLLQEQAQLRVPTRRPLPARPWPCGPEAAAGIVAAQSRRSGSNAAAQFRPSRLDACLTDLACFKHFVRAEQVTVFAGNGNTVSPLGNRSTAAIDLKQAPKA